MVHRLRIYVPHQDGGTHLRPDSASWADIEERIRFLGALDKGLADIKSGQVIPHKDVKESLKKWLST